MAASARPTSFRQYCELLLLLGRDYTAARRGPQWWQPSGRGTTSEHARPSCPMFRTLIRRWRRASKGGWDGMCTRGHVISKSEWIGVPALRRAHLLPPSRAPPSLLVGWLACWLRTAYGSKFAFSILAHLGWAEGGGGRAEKSFARPTGGDASMRAAWASDLPFESRTVGRGTKYGRTGALERFENANAIGVSG